MSSFASASVQLSWSDNSNNEDGFRVERSRNGTDFELVAIVGENGTGYTDSRCESGLTHYYRVCAFNEYGQSGYSNVASRYVGFSRPFDQWIYNSLDKRMSGVPDLSPDTDHSGSGLSSLLCYVHGIDPLDPDRTLLPRSVLVPSEYDPSKMEHQIERAMYKDAEGVDEELLVSTDLTHWETIEYDAEVIKEDETHRWERIVLPHVGSQLFYKFKYSVGQQSPL